MKHFFFTHVSMAKTSHMALPKFNPAGKYSLTMCLEEKGQPNILNSINDCLLVLYLNHCYKLIKLTLGKWYINIKNYFYLINLFIYFWLCWVFVSVRGLSLVAASGGHSSSWCAGLSLSRPLLLRSPGSRRAGSVVVAHGPSCSAACGIFPDQGSNPCPLH